MAKKTREDMRKRRHQRVRQKLAGTPERPRLNVYRSLAEIYAQVIDDAKGKTLRRFERRPSCAPRWPA
jgi:large subunit ribosomal protein L18